MIVPTRVAPPIALLVALLTVTVVYNAGIASAPRDFFGGREGVVLLLPGTGSVTSTGSVPAALAAVLRTRENVTAASPEILVLTQARGESLFVRGAEAAALFAIEGAHLTAGQLPTAPTDGLAGAKLAARLGLTVGDRLVVIGSLAAVAVPVRIVGIFETARLAADELVVSVALARSLAGLPAGGVHLIRVETTDVENITRLTASVVPTFTYSSVGVSADEVLAGEPIQLDADLTNWGVSAGSKEVIVRVNDIEAHRSFAYVPARTTLHLTIPIHIKDPGNATISINPTFNVSVREPSARFESIPPALGRGQPAILRVVDVNATSLPSVRVLLDGIEGTTDARGEVTLAPPTTGARRIEVRDAAGALMAAQAIYVVPEGYIDRPLGLAVGMGVVRALVGVHETPSVNVTLANVGGVAGPVEANVTVDGRVEALAQIELPPGRSGTVAVSLPLLPEGLHVVGLEGYAGVQHVESFPGNPRVEAALRAREAARANPSTAPKVGAAADEYVDRIVRNVTIAATALTVAAGTLAALGVLAVWSRHLAERARTVGTLKALGASREQVQGIAVREAAIVAGTATIAGIAVGIGIALGIDGTGYVRAFGHTIPPALRVYPLLLLALAVLAVDVVVARTIVGRMYERTVEELITGQAPRPQPDEAPTLIAALEGADS